MNPTEETPPPHKRARPSGKPKTSGEDDCDVAPAAASKHQDPDLVLALRKLDPLLQFLTRHSGKLSISLVTLRSILPAGYDAIHLLEHLMELHRRGVVCLFQVEEEATLEQRKEHNGDGPPLATSIASTKILSSSVLTWNSPLYVGFPPPPSAADPDFLEKQKIYKTIGSLHGSTKAAAQRRLRALKCSLKENPYPLPPLNQLATNLVSHDKIKADGRPSSGPLAPQPVTPASSENGESIHTLVPQAVTALHNNNSLQEPVEEGKEDENDHGCAVNMSDQEREARKAMKLLFRLNDQHNNKPQSLEKDTLSVILPDQAAYAGSHPSRTCCYADLSPATAQLVPKSLMEAYGLSRNHSSDETKETDSMGSSTDQLRQLYSHQVAAVESAMNRIHTLVCTSTGSGKSLCFWLPVLSAAYASSDSSADFSSMGRDRGASFVIFPTKALAQDQLSQLKRLLASNADLERRIRPATLDGDTPHSLRVDIAEWCNVILTNPDTIHSAILPNWRTMYQELLGKLDFVVLDEAHLYEGIFGAHVSLVLSRLHRICAVASQRRHQNSKSRSEASYGRAPRLLPTYLACSATMNHPEHHFRLLFPIAKEELITVLTADQDGSARSAKHFFVWNPPILDMSGLSVNRVTIPRPSPLVPPQRPELTQRSTSPRLSYRGAYRRNVLYGNEGAPGDGEGRVLENVAGVQNAAKLHRRHAADETALLLARAVACGVRCIAFCKTRMVVEWVYERTVAVLRSDSTSSYLAEKVESYRGGYNTMERRMIEQRLFQDEVLGVVATCALEVGVDIGGIDLTLHCGFPTSYASFIQQAGRARGKRLDVPSIAVMICFNSPAEQHIWRHPTRLLTQSLTTVPSMPFNFGIVQGHMLCASEEFPLMGSLPWTTLQQTVDIKSASSMMCDYELFGSTLMYEEALQMLVSAGSVVKETVAVASNESRTATVYKAHASARKPWTSVSLRSCEPVNYSVVDISHPGQGGRTDGIYDERAVMDHLPYSRVFYHAFPGAIITHRGRRYLVQSMTRPPPILPSISWGNGCNLAAYAKPTSARYITRPLSTLQTTSVKQMERLDLGHFAEKTAGLKTLCANVHDKLHSQSLSVEPLGLSFAGCGVLNVKRSVHGFKKLSMATLAEISRTEISMPPMEFDTFGVWIDTDACNLSRKLVDYGSGVHALSHALLAVSPLFVDCSLSDLDCEHSYFDPTRVVLFDNRPGGLGICAQLWKSLFAPKGLLDFAIELLEHCTTCSGDTSYNGGCPACLQSVKCLNFNHHLSKQAGLVVAKRMRQRLDESGLFTYDATSTSSALCTSPDRATTSFKRGTSKANTPRRKARAKALDIAKDIQTARDRSIVVGRPAWPLDDERGTDKQEKPE